MLLLLLGCIGMLRRLLVSCDGSLLSLGIVLNPGSSLSFGLVPRLFSYKKPMEYKKYQMHYTIIVFVFDLWLGNESATFQMCRSCQSHSVRRTNEKVEVVRAYFDMISHQRRSLNKVAPRRSGFLGTTGFPCSFRVVGTPKTSIIVSEPQDHRLLPAWFLGFDRDKQVNKTGCFLLRLPWRVC